MRRERKGNHIGNAEICPVGDIVVGRPDHWQIVYKCGERSIVAGGAVRVTIPYDFTPPQTAYPSAIGYTTVATSNPQVEMGLHLVDPQGERNEGVWGIHLFAQVEKGELREGDTVTIEYGQGDGGGLANVGAFARYFEGEAEFTVAVDPDGKRIAPAGGFLLIAGGQPRVRMIGDRAAQLFVVVPSTAAPEEEIPVCVTVRDARGNTAADFEGEIILNVPGGSKRSCRMSSGNRGCLETVLPSCQGRDVIRVQARTDGGKISGASNPCGIGRSADRRLYWGDIHVMTEISAGLGRPAEAYWYARDQAHLDFCAITDGDDADSYFSDEEWEETRAAVKDFYVPGRFVTLLGSEYHERRIAGDKNIYFREDDARLIRWSDLKGEQPDALWFALEGRKALTVPHHTVSGSAGLRPWDFHHPEFQRLVEIYSIWGNAEGEECGRPNYWRNNYQNSVRSALARGYRLGIIASGDSHDGRSGNSDWMRVRKGYRSGLVAVYAPELTREAVFDALWDRRCYGTSGPRILLDFALNKARMGQELVMDSDRSCRRLQIDAAGTAPLREIAVIRNGRAVYVRREKEEQAAFEWIDREEFAGIALAGYDGRPFVYYYIRILQEDGEMAWSSPIWVAESR